MPVSRYWWLGLLKLRTPDARLSGVLALPSPQLMTTVCVSRVPGSLKLPLSVVESFSLIVAWLKVNWMLDGGTLLTLTLVPALVLAPSPSVTVTEMA